MTSENETVLTDEVTTERLVDEIGVQLVDRDQQIGRGNWVGANECRAAIASLMRVALLLPDERRLLQERIDAPPSCMNGRRRKSRAVGDFVEAPDRRRSL